MLKLQKRMWNINLVTPTHYIPQILMHCWLPVNRIETAPDLTAADKERLEILRQLDGIVDITCLTSNMQIKI